MTVELRPSNLNHSFAYTDLSLYCNYSLWNYVGFIGGKQCDYIQFKGEDLSLKVLDTTNYSSNVSDSQGPMGGCVVTSYDIQHHSAPEPTTMLLLGA